MEEKKALKEQLNTLFTYIDQSHKYPTPRILNRGVLLAQQSPDFTSSCSQNEAHSITSTEDFTVNKDMTISRMAVFTSFDRQMLEFVL